MIKSFNTGEVWEVQSRKITACLEKHHCSCILYLFYTEGYDTLLNVVELYAKWIV